MVYPFRTIILISTFILLLGLETPLENVGISAFFFEPASRRIKDIKGSSHLRTIFTKDGRELKVNLDHFPDDELYVRLLEPQKVQGRSIVFSSSFDSSEDFLEIFLILGTLKQYGAKDISLVLESWKPQTYEDHLLLSLFRQFSDGIKIRDDSTGIISPVSVGPFSGYRKKDGALHIDRIAYIQPRFRAIAEEAVTRIQGASSHFLEVRESAGGHWSVSLPSDLSGQNIVLIHSTETSEDILGLLLVFSYLREAGVNSISLINTYQGYARQDKVFKPGEGVSGYTIVNALNRFLDYNFAVNVHYGGKSGRAVLAPEIWVEENGARRTLKTLPAEEVYNLNGFVQLAEKLVEVIKNERGHQEFRKYPLLLVSPDDGAFQYIQEAAVVLRERHGLQATAGYLDKKRISATEVTIAGPILAADGKPLRLAQPLTDYWIFGLDDETSTGGTLKASTYHLVEVLGADVKKIYTGVVHGKFATGIDRFYRTREKEMLPHIIISLDTVPLPQGIISASPAALISYAIKRILGQ